MTSIAKRKKVPSWATFAGFALSILAMPVVATEHPSPSDEFRCGKEFITLPVRLIDPNPSPGLVMTVRKSDVIAIAARAIINIGEHPLLTNGRIAINSVSDEGVGASREIRTFRLKEGIYDHVVACQN